MKDLSFLPGCSRKTPTQRRGRDRVAAMLTAAVAEFAASGYEAATMSAIARRARAPIGSLYQFFPNKQAVARALRTRQIMDVEELWTALGPRAAAGDLAAFVEAYVEVMVGFIHYHPAFLPLLDAPASTQPVGPRNRLRELMETLLRRFQPRLRPAAAQDIAEVVLNLNRAMMGLYARSPAARRPRVAAEYRAILHSYLARRLAVTPARTRTRRA